MYKCYFKRLKKNPQLWSGWTEENKFDSISSICSEVSIDIDENNNIWDYLEKTILFTSKTVVGDNLSWD